MSETIPAGEVRVERSLYEMTLELRKKHELEELGISYYDYQTTIQWAYDGDRWFHAASTMKIAVLLGVFREIEGGRFRLEDPLHVRNRFESIVDGSPFQLQLDAGSDPEVYGNLGKSMTIRDLAYYMITTSSNLATNLLVQLVGTSAIRQALVELEISGVKVVRGVEDQKAYDEGLNNMVTANGLAGLLRAIVEKRAFSEKACDEMLAILHDQKHRSGLPAGLPEDARIAHKTGNISTVHHDAGIVFVEGRRPYVLAILTQFDASRGRGGAVADLARHVHAALGELHDDE
jgi:beta-lactamase class A